MFVFICFVIVFLFCFHLCTRKYINPYKLYMVFGKKGSGKSTLMTRLAYQHLKKGWSVYCTEPINISGVRHFSVDMIGKRTFEENSLVLVDEVGMIWDNRDFKNFANSVRDWFKLQRHYKCKVYLFSQSFDIDKKLRDLTDGLYLCSTRARIFTWAKRIHRSIVLTQAEADRESRISENLEFDSILTWPFGGRIITFIPKYAKYFDSHSVPKKDPVPFKMMSSPVLPPAHERYRALFLLTKFTRPVVLLWIKLRSFVSAFLLRIRKKLPKSLRK